VTSLCIENPEAVKKWGDVRDWHHAIGTGPWILDDFVPGVSATMIKNPNYWGHDERYPQNKLPYINRVNFSIIPDQEKTMAEMRAGRIDVCDQISPLVSDIGLLPYSSSRSNWRIASMTALLPEPFSPAMTFNPGEKLILNLERKFLYPSISRCCKYINSHPTIETNVFKYGIQGNSSTFESIIKENLNSGRIPIRSDVRLMAFAAQHSDELFGNKSKKRVIRSDD